MKRDLTAFNNPKVMERMIKMCELWDEICPFIDLEGYEGLKRCELCRSMYGEQLIYFNRAGTKRQKCPCKFVPGGTEEALKTIREIVDRGQKGESF